MTAELILICLVIIYLGTWLRTWLNIVTILDKIKKLEKKIDRLE